MKPALLIIDMQNDFFQKDRLLEHQDQLVENINSHTQSARQHSVPIIWIRQVLKADLSDSPKGIKENGQGIVLEGTPGSELLAGLHVEASDIEVIKKRYSGFFNTHLDEVLASHNIDTLIIAGINTHACVRMTVIDGYQRDYNVIVAKDCVDSWDKEHHDITMKYFVPKIAQVKSNEEIVSLFG